MAESRLSIVPTMADLLADPAKGLDVPPREAAALLLVLAPVLKALELAAGKGRGTANGHEPEPSDRLLTPEQAGERLGFSVKQVYRRARRWPFTRHPSEGTLRFSERGLERWMAGKGH